MLPPALRALVVAERGVVLRRQLLDGGLAPSTIWRQVRRGDWTTHGRHVLIAAWAPDDFETRARAAMLSRPTLPATGLAAVLQYPQSPLGAMVHLGDLPWLVADRGTSRSWRRVSHPGATVVRRAGRLVLLQEDVLIDLLRLLPFEHAIEAAWLGMREGLTTPERLSAKAEPLLALAGRKQLRTIVEIAGCGARSSGEERMIRIVERAGMRGVPDYQVRVGQRRYRIDYAFPAQQVGLEFDGYRFHSGPSAARRGSQRHNILAGAGWDLRYFTWYDVTQAAGALVEQVSTALARGSAAS